MKVRLMLTCLCDAFFGEVGIATVRVLEYAGCEVVFDERQTCCGQPPFNAGDWGAARKIATHCKSVFRGLEPIVTPSGSCAAMLRDGYPLLFPDEPTLPCFELGEFLVKELGITSWVSGGEPDVVAFHRACHGRALGLRDEQELLVRSMRNIQVVDFAQQEQCCGFGGAFAATHGKLSSGIGLEKLHNVMETGAKTLVSGDMGCLMHLNGLIQKHNLPLRTRHFAELLAEAIPV